MIEMIIKAFYDKARRTIVEIVEGGRSWLRYRGNDNLFHYLKTYDAPDASGDEIQLKTINSESLKGTGDITVATPVQVVTVSGSTPTQELAPNTFYEFGAVDSLTLTLGAPISGVLNVYSFSFTASESFDPSTDLSLPEGVLLNGEISMEAGDDCEVSIRKNRATFTVWSVPAADPTDEPIAGE